MVLLPQLPGSHPDRHRTQVAKGPPSEDQQLRWAGHGHVVAFLVQLGVLIAVNLALWGLVFLMALKYAGRV